MALGAPVGRILNRAPTHNSDARPACAPAVLTARPRKSVRVGIVPGEPRPSSRATTLCAIVLKYSRARVRACFAPRGNVREAMATNIARRTRRDAVKPRDRELRSRARARLWGRQFHICVNQNCPRQSQYLDATGRLLRSYKYFPVRSNYFMDTFSRKETIPKFDPINPRRKFALALGVFFTKRYK